MLYQLIELRHGNEAPDNDKMRTEIFPPEMTSQQKKDRIVELLGSCTKAEAVTKEIDMVRQFSNDQVELYLNTFAKMWSLKHIYKRYISKN